MCIFFAVIHVTFIEIRNLHIKTKSVYHLIITPPVKSHSYFLYISFQNCQCIFKTCLDVFNSPILQWRPGWVLFSLYHIVNNTLGNIFSCPVYWETHLSSNPNRLPALVIAGSSIFSEPCFSFIFLSEIEKLPLFLLAILRKNFKSS